MQRVSLLALTTLLLWSGTAGALDLTPRYVPVPAGELVRRLHFVDGSNRYAMELPLYVELSTEDGSVAFRFAKLEGAMLLLKRSPVSPAIPFTEPSLEDYRKAALGFVPPGSIAVKIEAENAVPGALGQWDGYRFLISYDLPGRSFHLSVLFVGVSPKQQIVLTTFALDSVFESASAISAQIISSWRKAGPEEHLEIPPCS